MEDVVFDSDSNREGAPPGKARAIHSVCYTHSPHYHSALACRCAFVPPAEDPGGSTARLAAAPTPMRAKRAERQTGAAGATPAALDPKIWGTKTSPTVTRHRASRGLLLLGSALSRCRARFGGTAARPPVVRDAFRTRPCRRRPAVCVCGFILLERNTR